MTPGTLALALLVGIVLAGSAVGFLAGRRREPRLEEWAVAGRGLGVLLVWLLMAGENFTAFSVLGLSGWIYSKGGPTLYILVYLALGQMLLLFVGPLIWEFGRRHGLQTIGDFFSRRYASGALGLVVALTGVIFLIVYLQLQVTSLGIIVEVCSFGQVGRLPAMVAATALTAAFVLVSGVRAIVWVSVLKDFLLVLVAAVVGIGIPYHFFGGIGPMFAAVEHAHPAHLTMPGSTTANTHSWYVTTVLVSSLGLTWPHLFAGIFTAKSGDTVRKNAILTPLHLLPLVLIVFAGCAAIIAVPNLPNGDLSLLMVARLAFPPWVLGVIGGAGALTAMVPAGVQMLAASNLIAKNVVPQLARGPVSEEVVTRYARFGVMGVAGLALYLSMHSSATLVSLLILAYSGVGQFAPGIVLGMFFDRVSPRGVMVGIVGGLAVTGALVWTHHDPFHGINTGFIGLCVNLALVGLASWVDRKEPILSFDALGADQGTM
jgi:solute:Na+ symporter, SSS family